MSINPLGQSKFQPPIGGPLSVRRSTISFASKATISDWVERKIDPDDKTVLGICAGNNTQINAHPSFAIRQAAKELASESNVKLAVRVDVNNHVWNHVRGSLPGGEGISYEEFYSNPTPWLTKISHNLDSLLLCDFAPSSKTHEIFTILRALREKIGDDLILIPQRPINSEVEAISFVNPTMYPEVVAEDSFGINDFDQIIIPSNHSGLSLRIKRGLKTGLLTHEYEQNDIARTATALVHDVGVEDRTFRETAGEWASCFYFSTAATIFGSRSIADGVVRKNTLLSRLEDSLRAVKWKTKSKTRVVDKPNDSKA